MPDYKNSKIYILTNGTDSYYGSTTQKLHRRLIRHRCGYCSSRVLFGEDKTVRIILLENYPCDNRKELLLKERWYIENFECVNNNIPNRSPKEYREDNKEKLKIKRKEWNSLPKTKENRQNYYNKFKVSIAEKMKKYNQDNKEKIKAHNSIPYECECGSKIQLTEKARHQRSKKHLNFFV